MEIRTRQECDGEALASLVRIVHQIDGYPVELADNPVEFIVTANCHAAWVAVSDGAVCGHVSLHTVWSDAVAEMACAYLDCDRSGLGAVSRLFVDPDHRDAGVGRRLMDSAVEEALRRGLWPVLDVVTSFAPAVALYERSGWLRLGTALVEMPDRDPVEEYVYVLAPPLNNSSGGGMA